MKITRPRQKTLAQATAIKSDADRRSADRRPDRGRRTRQEGLVEPVHLPREYAMADCKGYKAPKTSSTSTPRRAPEPGMCRSQDAAQSVTELDAMHPAAAARVPVGSRAGRALDRPAHHRGGLRAGRRRAAARRRQAARRARRRAVPGPLPVAAARGARRRRPAAVAEHVIQKLIRRHPHVFGETEVADAARGAAQLGRDQAHRARPRARRLRRGAGEPAGAAATPASSSAGPPRGGFDFPDVDRPFSRVRDELAELEAAGPTDERFHELGDLLFAAVNVARKLHVDPELALRAASDRFRVASRPPSSWRHPRAEAGTISRPSSTRLLRPRAA